MSSCYILFKTDIKFVDSQLTKFQQERESLKTALSSYSERFRLINVERQELFRSNENVSDSVNSEENSNRKAKVADLSLVIESEENARAALT